jgi:hypothetical protein
MNFIPTILNVNYYPNITNTNNTCIKYIYLYIINLSFKISQFYPTAIPDCKEMSYLNVQDRIQGGDMHQTIHNIKQSLNHCITLFIRK